MQVLQPQGLFINKPFYTSIHKHCFYTSPAFKQALLLHKSVFTQDLLLHKPCFYTSAVFTQALLLHKTCFYTNAVFTQALSLHKHCLYTRPAFTQKRFYTRPPFTQTLSLHKLCLYTSIACIQALLLHNDILLTKAFCNLQTGNRLEGRRNAEGCKYIWLKKQSIYFTFYSNILLKKKVSQIWCCIRILDFCTSDCQTLPAALLWKLAGSGLTTAAWRIPGKSVCWHWRFGGDSKQKNWLWKYQQTDSGSTWKTAKPLVLSQKAGHFNRQLSSKPVELKKQSNSFINSSNKNWNLMKFNHFILDICRFDEQNKRTCDASTAPELRGNPLVACRKKPLRSTSLVQGSRAVVWWSRLWTQSARKPWVSRHFLFQILRSFQPLISKHGEQQNTGLNWGKASKYLWRPNPYETIETSAATPRHPHSHAIQSSLHTICKDPGGTDQTSTSQRGGEVASSEGLKTTAMGGPFQVLNSTPAAGQGGCAVP